MAANRRPKNSALEVDLDFEHAARPPPVITEEVTASLEDLIRQRVAEVSSHGHLASCVRPPDTTCRSNGLMTWSARSHLPTPRQRRSWSWSVLYRKTLKWSRESTLCSPQDDKKSQEGLAQIYEVSWLLPQFVGPTTSWQDN